jgi:hypothetical protein
MLVIEKPDGYLITVGINGNEKRDNFSDVRVLFAARGTIGL